MPITIISYARHVNFEIFDPINRGVWENLAKAFKIDKHFYITEDYPVMYSPSFRKVRSLEVAISYVDAVLVNVRPAERFKEESVEFTWLDDFKHPPNACYCFGPNVGSAPLVKTDQNVALRIEPTELYDFTAASILLYHRQSNGCL